MKFVTNLTLIGATVRGVDLRDDCGFEDFCVVNDETVSVDTEHVRKYIQGQYGIRGFEVKEVVLNEPVKVPIDLQELYKQLITGRRIVLKPEETETAGASPRPTGSDAGRDDPGAPDLSTDTTPSGAARQLPQEGAEGDGNTPPPPPASAKGMKRLPDGNVVHDSGRDQEAAGRRARGREAGRHPEQGEVGTPCSNRI